MPRKSASQVKPRNSFSKSTGTSKANPTRKPRYRKHPPSPICTPMPQTISITAPRDGAAAAPPGPNSTDQPRPAAPNPPTKHGLARRNLVVCAEDAAFYQQFTASLTALFDPRDDNERFIVEQMIIHRWFILHADASEAAAMRVAMQRAAQPPKDGDPPHPARIYPSATSQPFPDPADPTDPSDNTARDSAALQMDLATAALCCDNNVQLITRYRVRHERAHDRWERIFHKCRAAREGAEQIRNLFNPNDLQPQKANFRAPAHNPQCPDFRVPAHNPRCPDFRAPVHDPLFPNFHAMTDAEFEAWWREDDARRANARYASQPTTPPMSPDSRKTPPPQPAAPTHTADVANTAAPANAAIPTTPADTPAPSVPADSTVPANTAISANNAIPATPADTGAAAAHATPVAPAAPAAPATAPNTATPANTSIPTNTAIPAKSTDPAAPAAPSAPAAPTAPATPADSVQPPKVNATSPKSESILINPNHPAPADQPQQNAPRECPDPRPYNHKTSFTTPTPATRYNPKKQITALPRRTAHRGAALPGAGHRGAAPWRRPSRRCIDSPIPTTMHQSKRNHAQQNSPGGRPEPPRPASPQRRPNPKPASRRSRV